MKKTESTTIYDVVLVPFPFANLRSKKQRPCLVLQEIHAEKLEPLYIVAMITSNVAGLRFPEDCEIADLKTAGLPKTSLIRTCKIVSLEKSLIRKKLGKLSSADQVNFKGKFKRLFSELL